MRAAEWENLRKGVKALKLWKTTGPKRPEIAILLLSRHEYKAFRKQPKAYINGFKIFGTKGTRTVRCFGLGPVKPKPDTLYCVIVRHQMDCTSVAISGSSN